MTPGADQLSDWERRLHRLMVEMNEATGPTAADTYPPDYECATRLAFVTVAAERRSRTPLMAAPPGFHCPKPPTDGERENYEAEGRAAAEEHGRGYIFTDGLGAMGCGSWDDGPASIKQAAYYERLRELQGPVVDG